MKLSDALRLGEFALPPIRGRSWFALDNGNLCGACAVGRLMYAVGYRPNDDCDNFHPMQRFADLIWPWIKDAADLAPKGTIAEEFVAEFTWRKSLLFRISDLYEKDGWSMGKIADFVATIEPAELPSPLAASEVREVEHVKV